MSCALATFLRASPSRAARAIRLNRTQIEGWLALTDILGGRRPPMTPGTLEGASVSIQWTVTPQSLDKLLSREPISALQSVVGCLELLRTGRPEVPEWVHDPTSRAFELVETTVEPATQEAPADEYRRLTGRTLEHDRGTLQDAVDALDDLEDRRLDRELSAELVFAQAGAIFLAGGSVEATLSIEAEAEHLQVLVG